MASKRQQPATLHDVAHKVGVSTRTVSRVVNDESGFSEQTRLLVEEAITELGRNRHCAGLVGGTRLDLTQRLPWCVGGLVRSLRDNANIYRIDLRSHQTTDRTNRLRYEPAVCFSSGLTIRIHRFYLKLLRPPIQRQNLAPCVGWHDVCEQAGNKISNDTDRYRSTITLVRWSLGRVLSYFPNKSGVM